MKTVYEAAHGVEAHMLCDLLQQEGIEAHVRGAALQGALGDLPVAGLVRIEVDEADYEPARARLKQWEAQQALIEPPPPAHPGARTPTRGRLLTGLAMGVLLGVTGAWIYFRAPTHLNGMDYNGDGRLDERWTYSASGLPLKLETDRNLDDHVDYRARFDDQGKMISADSDDNFDGVFETHIQFEHGEIEQADVDTDGDGFADMRTHYSHGVAESAEYFDRDTGLALRVDHYRLGKLVYADVDSNHDGKLDTRIDYTPLQDVSSRQPL